VFSLEAKQQLSQLINGQKIELEVISTDNFGRLVAFVFKDNLFVNEVMLTRGLAQKSDIKSQYRAQLYKAEHQAQQTKIGIWGLKCQHPKNCNIKGNYRRDNKTKIYHLPQCYNYQKIVINLNRGDKWFCSESQAIKAGFTKSKDCPE